MSRANGHTVPLTLAQRGVCDFTHVCRDMPAVPFQKEMHLAELMAARRLAQPRPSWCALFTKAYAKVVATRRELCRAYLSFPWERLFAYDAPTADIVLEARLGNEDVLVGLLLKQPEARPLLEIDRLLADYREHPLERSKRFRDTLRISRLPRFLRRLAWWYALRVSGSARARYLGTFGVSSVSNWGVDSLRPIAPWTTTLHYGVVDSQGKVTVRITFDHRVMNGSSPAKALNEMEHFLQTDLLAEVRALPGHLSKAG